MPFHEIRFADRGAWASAFERLIGNPATEACVAQPADLTLRVRTRDVSSLALDGRIVERRETRLRAVS